MVARLYDSTPLHRDNFIKLVEQEFYDSLLFHRVINQFMIQGGDPIRVKMHPTGYRLVVVLLLVKGFLQNLKVLFFIRKAP